MSLDLIEKAGKRQKQPPKGKKYWQYLGKYKCSFCGKIVIRCRPNENNSCGCQQQNRSVYRKATGPTSHIRHDRTWAVCHCAKYRGCLDRVIYEPGFKMDCKTCDNFKYQENCFQDEIRDLPHGGDSFGEHDYNIGIRIR